MGFIETALTILGAWPLMWGMLASALAFCAYMALNED